ncbi:hypothetical protein TNCT_408281 [Trichonephila clavata]|uniref:Uncharacterized protein n=1 Tax=Trichonephila clavata TaxID=2740835 RepID=A0A8X6IFJ5_TRICU|nr:hypothetical protein TNCT_408281 [Trichonephila clavata]
MAVYYWIISVLFVFIPLLLLAFFNAFLIKSVHSSKSRRKTMTRRRDTGDQSLPRKQLCDVNRSCDFVPSVSATDGCNSSVQGIPSRRTWSRDTATQVGEHFQLLGCCPMLAGTLCYC